MGGGGGEKPPRKWRNDSPTQIQPLGHFVMPNVSESFASHHTFRRANSHAALHSRTVQMTRKRRRGAWEGRRGGGECSILGSRGCCQGLRKVDFTVNMTIKLFSTVCSFHVGQYPLVCAASTVVYYSRVLIQLYFSWLM